MASRLVQIRQRLGAQLSGQDGQGSESDENLLALCFTLYAEHLMGAEQPLTAATVFAILPQIRLVTATPPTT